MIVTKRRIGIGIRIVEDDYKKILELQNLIQKKKMESLDIQKQINLCKTEIQNKQNLTIREETTFLGSRKYCVGSKSFNSPEEAKAYLDSCLAAAIDPTKTSLEEQSLILEKNKTSINEAINEMNSIKQKYVPMPQE